MRPPLGHVVSLAAYFMATLAMVGQGTVFFINFGGPNVNAPFFDERGVRLEGSGYLAQLYFWKAGSGFLPAAGGATPFSTNGYFNGWGVALPGVRECGSAWVQVRAWAAQGGATFEDAAIAGAWTGVSNIIFLDPLGSPGRPEACVFARLFGLQYPGSPLIVQQPKPVTVRAGAPATLSVLASSGVGMDFQWYRQPSDRPDGLIPGATNATFTATALATNTTFWVRVSNSAGSTLSAQATVKVLASPPGLDLAVANRQPLLTLQGLPGVTYRIEYSANVQPTDWTQLVEVTLSSSPFTFLDSASSNAPARFYRAVAP